MRHYVHSIEFEDDGILVVYGYWNQDGWWSVSSWMIPENFDGASPSG